MIFYPYKNTLITVQDTFYLKYHDKKQAIINFVKISVVITA